MNKEQLIIEITKELQLYNKVSLHTMGNISDLIDKYTEAEVNKISSKPIVIKSLPTTLEKWCKDIMMSAGGFRVWEDREFVIHKNRDIAIVEWTIRCLGNPKCEGSDYVMEKLDERRKEVVGNVL